MSESVEDKISRITQAVETLEGRHTVALVKIEQQYRPGSVLLRSWCATVYRRSQIEGAAHESCGFYGDGKTLGESVSRLEKQVLDRVRAVAELLERLEREP